MKDECSSVEFSFSLHESHKSPDFKLINRVIHFLQIVELSLIGFECIEHVNGPLIPFPFSQH